jgi:hypothetical protein
MGHNMRKFLLTCVVTLYQAIWTSSNDIVFHNSSTKTYMQYAVTLSLDTWTPTLGEETTMVKDVCRAWETMVMQISIGDSVIELIYHRC